jgi:predicted dehydrogenase
MSRKIIAGIMSFGMSGKVFHAPLLSYHSGFQLKTICERSKYEAKALYPNVYIVHSIDELLNDQDIELVIVNTPDHTHAELAHKALMAGKHVVVEKPFTLNASEAEDLLNLAIRKKKIITVFHNRRWDGDFLTIQKIVKNDLLGRLVEYEAHFERFRNFIQPNTWKEDGTTGTGTLYNLGSHLIDQALTLFGMPDRIYADINTFRTEGQVDDFFDLHLYYQNLRVALKASYLVREPGPRYSLHGTHGSYLKYGIDPQEEALKRGFLPTNHDWGKEPESYWGTMNTDKRGLHYVGKIETFAGNYPAFYDNVYDAIVQGAELAVKPQEAINVVKIIEAAYESSKAKKEIEL